MGGKDGLVHVSEMKNERVEKPGDVVSEGQEVKVKVLEIDPRGKVRLSMRVVDQETGAELEDTRPPREGRDGSRRRAATVTGARAARRRRPWPWPRRDGGGGGRGGDRDRGPRREGGDDRPRGERGEGGGERPWRPRPAPERSNDDGPAPEFAPAFLTRDDD